MHVRLTGEVVNSIAYLTEVMFQVESFYDSADLMEQTLRLPKIVVSCGGRAMGTRIDIDPGEPMRVPTRHGAIASGHAPSTVLVSHWDGPQSPTPPNLSFVARVQYNRLPNGRMRLVLKEVRARFQSPQLHCHFALGGDKAMILDIKEDAEAKVIDQP